MVRIVGVMLHRVYAPGSLVGVAKSQLASGAYKPVSALTRKARKSLLGEVKRSRVKQRTSATSNSRFSRDNSITSQERRIRANMDKGNSSKLKRFVDEGKKVKTDRGVVHREFGSDSVLTGSVKGAAAHTTGSGRKPGEQIILRNKGFMDKLTSPERKKILAHESTHAGADKPMKKRKSSYHASKIIMDPKRAGRSEAHADWRGGIKMNHRVKRADRDVTNKGYQSGGIGTFPKGFDRKSYFKLRRKFDEVDNPGNKARVKSRFDPRTNASTQQSLTLAGLGGASVAGVAALQEHDKRVAARRKKRVGV